jgi:hypothetical protein
VGDIGSISFSSEMAGFERHSVGVAFRDDGYLVVKFSTSTPGTLWYGEDVKELQPYTPGTWYKVKVILDRSTSTFSVWINDELKASGIKTKDTRV